MAPARPAARASDGRRRTPPPSLSADERRDGDVLAVGGRAIGRVRVTLGAERRLAPGPKRGEGVVAGAFPRQATVIGGEGHASKSVADRALIPEPHRLARLHPFRDIRAAVVGTGFIGVVHVEALRRLGVEVTGIVGSSAERAAEKAGAHNLPDPYGSFEAMLADDRVDVVHLATPNHLHDGQVLATLAAGKHVVCEKPLAITSVKTSELLELAEASGRVHAVNFNQRFYPNNLHARELIAGGTLGDVRMISGGYLQDWLLYDTDWSWRLER